MTTTVFFCTENDNKIYIECENNRHFVSFMIVHIALRGYSQFLDIVLSLMNVNFIDLQIRILEFPVEHKIQK